MNVSWCKDYNDEEGWRVEWVWRYGDEELGVEDILVWMSEGFVIVMGCVM